MSKTVKSRYQQKSFRVRFNEVVGTAGVMIAGGWMLSSEINHDLKNRCKEAQARVVQIVEKDQSVIGEYQAYQASDGKLYASCSGYSGYLLFHESDHKNEGAKVSTDENSGLKLHILTLEEARERGFLKYAGYFEKLPTLIPPKGLSNIPDRLSFRISKGEIVIERK